MPGRSPPILEAGPRAFFRRDRVCGRKKLPVGCSFLSSCLLLQMLGSRVFAWANGRWEGIPRQRERDNGILDYGVPGGAGSSTKGLLVRFVKTVEQTRHAPWLSRASAALTGNMAYSEVVGRESTLKEGPFLKLHQQY